MAEGNKLESGKSEETLDKEKWEKEWSEFSMRRQKSEREYEEQGIREARSLSVMNDEEFGPILAVVDRTDIDLARKYDINGVIGVDEIHALMNDSQRDSREQNYRIVEALTGKILSGQTIDPRDFESSRFPDFDWFWRTRSKGRELRDDEKRSILHSIVWHYVCQYGMGWLRANMPGIFEIPKDEKGAAIRAAMEKYIKENLRPVSKE